MHTYAYTHVYTHTNVHAYTHILHSLHRGMHTLVTESESCRLLCKGTLNPERRTELCGHWLCLTEPPLVPGVTGPPSAEEVCRDLLLKFPVYKAGRGGLGGAGGRLSCYSRISAVGVVFEISLSVPLLTAPLRLAAMSRASEPSLPAAPLRILFTPQAQLSELYRHSPRKLQAASLKASLY